MDSIFGTEGVLNFYQIIYSYLKLTCTLCAHVCRYVREYAFFFTLFPITDFMVYMYFFLKIELDRASMKSVKSLQHRKEHKYFMEEGGGGWLIMLNWCYLLRWRFLETSPLALSYSLSNHPRQGVICQSG